LQRDHLDSTLEIVSKFYRSIKSIKKKKIKGLKKKS
jgi:hypothetical protein